jgi:YceI-like domain
MPTQRVIHSLFLAVLGVCFSHAGFAQTLPENPPPPMRTIRLEASPISTLSLDGTSTMHAYRVAATTVSSVLQVRVPLSEDNDNDALRQALASSRPMAVDTRIPVAGLTSGEKGLDKNMSAALKADKYADIVFHMNNFTAVPVSDHKNTFVVTSQGTLNIAGVERPITLVAEVVVEHGALLITGTTTVSMLDFDVTPPTFLLGTIKTGPTVVIHFALTMRSPTEQSASK